MTNLHLEIDSVCRLIMTVINDHGYVPFVVIGMPSVFRSWLVGRFVKGVTQRLPLVEQELLALSEASHKRFLGKSCDIDIKTCIKYTGQTKYSTT